MLQEFIQEKNSASLISDHVNRSPKGLSWVSWKRRNMANNLVSVILKSMKSFRLLRETGT